MFIVSLNYVKDLTDIEAHLSDHVAYLDRYYRQGVFLMSGRKQPRTGGIIVMQAESVEQVERIISEDLTRTTLKKSAFPRLQPQPPKL